MDRNIFKRLLDKFKKVRTYSRVEYKHTVTKPKDVEQNK